VIPPITLDAPIRRRSSFRLFHCGGRASCHGYPAGWPLPLVMIVQTMLVMGQNINYAALGDPAFGASSDHLFDLGLERREPLDSACDRPKVLARQRINLGT
jgi:hypothetical protein